MTDSPPPPGRPALLRRPAVLLAIALDLVVTAGAVGLVLLADASPVVLVLALILGIAPWASIIDEREGPPPRG